MARIPAHTMDDAPAVTRPLLAGIVQFSPTGRLLNMHAEMAHAPAVLDAYIALRQAAARHATLDTRLRSALMLTVAATNGNQYAITTVSMLALRSGWRQDQVESLLEGKGLGEQPADVLIAVVREATANGGHVGDDTWSLAIAEGWTSEQLAEAFASIGLALFTCWFLNYAATESDLPTGG